MKNIALKLTNLSKTYNNNVVALKGIDLEVAEGDFFALLGPNGAGKSTAIGIISSLVNRSGGSVSIFGNDIDKQRNAAKRCLGLVPQEFNFNVFEPVLEIVINQAGYYGLERRLARQRAEFYLKKLELWDKRDSSARDLSGGMKRRLMIARALIHEPRILILDEPTAGVDIEIRRSMWEFMREINHNGTTIILTTHYLEEAENLCRNIAIIDQGQLVENTSMKNLLTSLQYETLILDLHKPLQKLPPLKVQSARLVDEFTLEVEIVREQCLNALFCELNDHEIEVTSLRNKSNRLEQLFLTRLNNNGVLVSSDQGSNNANA